jgi:hypothetical protein
MMTAGNLSALVLGSALVAASSPLHTHPLEPRIPAASCQTVAARQWSFVASVQHPFRVWATCTASYEADLAAAIALLDKEWGLIKAYMGREPLPDLGDAGAGGDRAIDIYLLSVPDPAQDPSGAALYEDELAKRGTCGLSAAFESAPRGTQCAALAADAVAQAFAIPPFDAGKHPGKMSALVLLRRSQLNSADFIFPLTHELFHAFQYAFNYSAAFAGSPHWFVEASAVWSEWYFNRTSAAYPSKDHARMFARFQGDERALNDSLNGHTYAAYVWPVFMTEDGGNDNVGAAWRAMETKTDGDGLDDAIDQQRGFAENFRKFALRNRLDSFPGVNASLTNHTNPDPRFPNIKPNLVDLKTESSLPMKIPNLRAVYRRLAVKPEVKKLELDLTALQSADLDVDALVKIAGKWELRSLPAGGKVRFCRTHAKERVDEIELVVSNHQKRTGSVTGGLGVEALLEECTGWGGTITYEERGEVTAVSSFINGATSHSLLASVSVEDGEGHATIRLRDAAGGTERLGDKGECPLTSSSETNASGSGRVTVEIVVDDSSPPGEYRITIGSVALAGSWHETTSGTCGGVSIPTDTRQGTYDEGWSYDIRGVLDPARPGVLSGTLKEGAGTLHDPAIRVTWSLIRY